MAKTDSLSRTFPLKIRFRDSDLADSTRLTGFQKLNAQAFKAIERAIGDIYNTENATNSPLSDNPLYINSLGRALGSMANLVPVLSGVDEYSPTLSNKLKDATYNVIPHPDQSIKCEVGCKSDGYDPSDSTPVRKCLAGYDAFYRQQEGAQTTVCQTISCPGWSGRSGQLLDQVDCNPNLNSSAYRDYKIVLPPELRSTTQYSVKYVSNCGSSSYDRFRSDQGTTGFNSVDKTDPSNTWAISTITSGVASPIQYDYPNLNENSDYIVVVEVPVEDIGQSISINNSSFGTINGTSAEASRYLFDLTGLSAGTSLELSILPTSTSNNSRAAVSQIFIIEKVSQAHRNFNIPLLLPKALDGLSRGTEIPSNFVQLFDTEDGVNRIIDKTKALSTRFEIPGTTNISSNREAFDIRLYDNQVLEVGNDRYLTVTVGMDLATTIGALLEAFISHVSDPDIHLSEERICQLLQDKTFCCDNNFNVSIDSLSPSNKIATSPGDSYVIKTWIYGGTPPYTITVDWGDDITDTANSIVSGVQTYTLSSDRSPESFSPGNPSSFPFETSHIYSTNGTYTLSYVVQDDPDEGFGCTADITSSVSPFNVGAPPVIDFEVRLDNVTSYPAYAYTDINTGYNFTETAEADFDTASASFHTVTQVRSTDTEDGKPEEFTWVIDNPDGLSYQFYYENVTQVLGEALSIGTPSAAYSGTLANDGFIQQDSLVLKKSNGQLLVEGTDYNVNYISGTITAVVGQSIPANTTLTAQYYHYPYMTVGTNHVAEISGSQWTSLSTVQNGSTIDFANLTNKTDINTIRFKIKS